MNERIKELRDQAAKFAEVTYGNYTMTTFDTNKSIETLFEEKFAELIVRECIGCCEQVISDPVPNYYIDTWLNGGSQCIDEIKRHFGVEQ
jgi:hypothetical protein